MKLTYHYSTDKTMFTIVGEGDFTSVSVADILMSIAEQVKSSEDNRLTIDPEKISDANESA